MKTVIVHLPTEEELVLRRLGGKFNRLTLAQVADNINRNLQREFYGHGRADCIDGAIEIVFPN